VQSGPTSGIGRRGSCLGSKLEWTGKHPQLNYLPLAKLYV